MPVTLESRLPEIAASLRPRVSAAIKRGAGQVAEAADPRVPVESGALKGSVHVERLGPATYVVVADAPTRSNLGLSYAVFVESGTQYMEAEPYLLPAAEDQEATVAEEVAVVLRTL